MMQPRRTDHQCCPLRPSKFKKGNEMTTSPSRGPAAPQRTRTQYERLHYPYLTGATRTSVYHSGSRP